VAGGPLAAMTAIYTAFLFAQAKARDLWQSPLLPPHLVVQAVVVGSAALLLLEPVVAVPHAMVSWLLAAAAAVHVGMVLGEVALTHGTAHARLAARDDRGRVSPGVLARARARRGRGRLAVAADRRADRRARRRAGESA
jgi:hypothetical protein